MKKRILCILFTCLMLFTACAAPAAVPTTATPAPEAAGTEQAPAADAQEAAAAQSEQSPVPEEPAGDGEEKADWTVLLYLCGTDLETGGAMATENLKEIANTYPSDSVNVVIQTGGTEQWQTEEPLGLSIPSDKLARYHFDASGYTLDEELPLAPMSSPDTLSDFIRWASETYPAEKYMLLLWDHGGGSYVGMIVDELHNNSIMSLEEFSRALAGGGVNFEAILLDTCLMASLETAQAAAPYAKYLIASEESVPGSGTAYDKWLQYMYDTPSCDGAKLGRVVCDTVQQKYAEMGYAASGTVTFSVMDLAKIDAVTEAFGDMMLEVSELLQDPADFQYFSYFTQRVELYSDKATHMVDLGDMAYKAKGVAISNQVADAVVDAVNDAVVYSVKGVDRSYGHGISFYYCLKKGADKLDHYARNCPHNPEYLAFLDAVNQGWSAPDWVYEKTERVPEIKSDDYLIDMKLSAAEDGGLQLNITRGLEAVTAVDYCLLQRDKESGILYELGTNFDVDGDFTTGVFTDRFDGMWPAIDGVFCAMNLIEQTPTHNRYSIPVILYDDTSHFLWQLRAGYRFDVSLLEQPEEVSAQEGPDATPAQDGEQPETDAAQPEQETDILAGKYELYGLWAGTDENTNLPNRSVVDLIEYKGYACAPLFRGQDKIMGWINNMMRDKFIVREGLTMEREVLPAGEYVYVFQVTDVFGEIHNSDPVTLAWDGKEATFLLLEEEG